MTLTNDAPTTPAGPPSAPYSPDPDRIERALGKRSFATLATVSPKGRPHVSGVLYDLAGGFLFANTKRTTRKARNIETNPHVAVAIPIRRVPVGPPSLVHFQATAELLPVDDAQIRDLATAGALKTITSHGELDLADLCFIRIPLPARLQTYGLGMPLRALIRDPLNSSGVVSRPQ